MFGIFGKSKQDHRVKLLPSGIELEVKAGDNLLKACLTAGLGWPHDCRVGSCGTCKCRLVEGKIKELADFAYVLDGDQLNNGMILACQTLLKSDAVVEIELNTSDSQAAAVGNVAGRVTATRMLTHDIVELTVELERPLREDGGQYKAGQYADLTFPGIANPRSYSFAAPPENDNERGLLFYIRKVPNGELTTWLFEKDRTGSEVEVSGPYGSFWLREGVGPVVCQRYELYQSPAGACGQCWLLTGLDLPVWCQESAGPVLPRRDAGARIEVEFRRLHALPTRALGRAHRQRLDRSPRLGDGAHPRSGHRLAQGPRVPVRTAGHD